MKPKGGPAMQLEDYFEFERFDTEFGPGEEIRIKGTRLAIEVLLEEFLQGATAEQIQQNYPTASREQVYATITYYLHNQEAIDAYLERSRALAAAKYQQWLRTHTPSALENRLRAVREASRANKQGT
jgi:uncharacterized protein (DUF433 family)